MKQKLLLAGGLVLGFSATVQASQSLGSSFTLGSSANPASLMTSLSNPAAPYFMVNSDEGDSFRTGILGPVSVGYEVGEVDSLEDKIDELDDLLDQEVTTVTQALEIQNQANDLIAQMGQDANLKVMLGMPVPIFPVIYKANNGNTFMLDVSVSSIAKGNFLDDDIDVVIDDSGNYALETNSSLYAKAGVDLNIGLGYSSEVFNSDSGTLVLGTKLNFHSVTLGKALLHLESSDEDTEDAFSDAFSDQQETTTGFGLDLGAIWAADHYQIGIQGTNLNEPSFAYGELPSDCTSATPLNQQSCEAALAFASAGDIELKEDYTMERQFALEASTFVFDRQLSLAASYELNEVADLVGDDYQWATLSSAYYSSSSFIPAVRVGYKKNMAGSELSYAMFGATLFKRLNLDLAYGLDKVEIDGDEQPRSLYFSAGIESAF
ncbi:conjugal transfer protein TraF [Marinomonas ostreistagni]|uniref:Conjugal transfer protein TraF n=1 Tax=Marinomonas ostreistagni TaxID=359209 RepID=A0ABS0ZB28_9GAMM|nr:conjugal transfer protein TraF [Marinomonas ostreistagni]MBJ7550837.1 conjugal transfer protein TraF [Marinomonas ostreistagni]